MFAPSTHLKPALGRVFDQFVDLHVMISKVPKSREDAEIAYAGATDSMESGDGDGDGERGEGASRSSRDVNECLIFEVLRDECPVSAVDRAAGRRFADREGRCGFFEIGPDSLELRDAF